jgi:hypothetical protein
VWKYLLTFFSVVLGIEVRTSSLLGPFAFNFIFREVLAIFPWLASDHDAPPLPSE